MINLKENIAIEEIEESKMLQDLKDKGYIYRHVHSYPELIEKIKIFDQKLNDEVVEKIKSEILVTLSTSLQEAVEDVEDAMIHFFFEKLEKSIFKKKLLFVFFLHHEELMAINYNIKKLNKIDRKQLFDVDMLRVSK